MPNEPVIITETAADGSVAEFELSAAKADETSGSIVEEVVSAIFDDGTQDDNVITVTAADTDGDGLFDTAVADTNNDGTIDTAVMDTDGDGQFDTGVADTDGDGKIDMVAVDTDGDGLLDTAVADTDGDGIADTVMMDTDGDGEFDTTESIEDFEAGEGLPTEEELSMNSVEFNLGSEWFEDTAAVIPEDEPMFEPAVEEPYFAESMEEATPYETASSTEEPAVDLEAAEREAQAEIAREAQAAADEFVDKGDYAAAAEAREQAEDAAWAASDSSMLGASDSADMEQAAYQQEVAEDYRAQQADLIAEGDYAGAKEAAENAAYATSDADFRASGDDHSGQSDQDAYNLGNAVSDEKNAQYFADNAEWYAEQGNMDAAESSAANAETYQASADSYADLADPMSTGYDVDPSSAVETGGTYDAGGYDMSAVDTGFDAGAVDTTSSYDTGLDDTTV